MKIGITPIPESLVYEKINGRPVYYRGYREYLLGQKTEEELMGSSYLQALVVSELFLLLSRHLDLDQYRILPNELGLKMGRQSRRAADLAIIDKKRFQHIPVENKYLGEAPEVVIEIDTKAEVTDVGGLENYYKKKTADLLNFGVKKVIWIFTEPRTILLAEPNSEWQIVGWDHEVEVLGNAHFCLQTIINDTIA